MARMELEEKLRGARLGGALGDAIGELAFRLGDRAALTAAVDRRPSLVYTDDTAMAIGVAEVLVAHGGLDPETRGRRFHDNYRREPWRGYRPVAPEGRGREPALQTVGRGRDRSHTQLLGGHLQDGLLKGDLVVHPRNGVPLMHQIPHSE